MGILYLLSILYSLIALGYEWVWWLPVLLVVIWALFPKGDAVTKTTFVIEAIFLAGIVAAGTIAAYNAWGWFWALFPGFMCLYAISKMRVFLT
jgi:hypothetical protein